MELITTNGSCADTAYMNIMVYNTTGIVDIAAGKEIAIYPNPANDAVTIEWAQQTQVNNIRIFNSAGKELSLNYSPIGLNRIQYSTADLAPGFYIITLDAGGERLIRRLVIAH